MEHAARSHKHAVLLAFACDPHRGSEPGAGWAALRVMAEVFDTITVVTSTFAPETLRDSVKDLDASITVMRLTTPQDDSRVIYRHYLSWVRTAAKALRPLLEDSPPLVLQHATFASDWMPSPLAALPRRVLSRHRVVWGPVGGATYPPFALTRSLGARFILTSALRSAATRTSRLLSLPLHRRRADLAIALNRDTAAALRRFPAVTVRANAVLEALEPGAGDDARITKSVVFAARAAQWKGVALVHAMAAHLGSDWTVHFYGEGTEALREQTAPDRARIVLHGAVPRTEILAALESATVYALPSLHDSAPWAAGEAASLGVPVLCLDLGGVPQMAGPHAVVVPHGNPAELPRLLAEACERVAAEARPRTPYLEWTLESQARFFAPLLDPDLALAPQGER